MQPIYDRSGNPVAWLNAGHVYGLDGSHAAFVRGWNVHGNAGEHLGVLRDGFFRDPQGDCVAFLAGARRGPSQPTRAATPRTPQPMPAAAPALFAVPPVAAVPSVRWSALGWAGFLEGRGS
jgi:hypothetical protein